MAIPPAKLMYHWLPPLSHSNREHNYCYCLLLASLLLYASLLLLASRLLLEFLQLLGSPFSSWRSHCCWPPCYCWLTSLVLLAFLLLLASFLLLASLLNLAVLSWCIYVLHTMRQCVQRTMYNETYLIKSKSKLTWIADYCKSVLRKYFFNFSSNVIF